MRCKRITTIPLTGMMNVIMNTVEQLIDTIDCLLRENDIVRESASIRERLERVRNALRELLDGQLDHLYAIIKRVEWEIERRELERMGI